MVKKSIAKLDRFAACIGAEPVWVGVDVHKRDYHVALRSDSGLSETFVCPGKPAVFLGSLLKLGLKLALVAYEAGPTGHTLARALEESGLPVMEVAPSKILRPVSPGAKTDRLDCLKLAKYAAKGMLKPIAIPSVEEEADRSLIRRRYKVVESLRRVKQRIKSMLLNHGFEEPDGLEGWSKKAVSELERIGLPGQAKRTMESNLRELRFFQKELARIDKELKRLAGLKRHRAKASALRTIPGVGPVAAMSFCLEVFNPGRFRRAEEIASYLGLAPTVRQSGQGKTKGRIIPTGQKRLRSTLIEAAWTWKRYDPQAREMYNRLLARSGVTQKAICAVARKLAIIMWRLCLEQRPYRQVEGNA